MEHSLDLAAALSRPIGQTPQQLVRDALRGHDAEKLMSVCSEAVGNPQLENDLAGLIVESATNKLKSGNKLDLNLEVAALAILGDHPRLLNLVHESSKIYQTEARDHNTLGILNLLASEFYQARAGGDAQQTLLLDAYMSAAFMLFLDDGTDFRPRNRAKTLAQFVTTAPPQEQLDRLSAVLVAYENHTQKLLAARGSSPSIGRVAEQAVAGLLTIELIPKIKEFAEAATEALTRGCGNEISDPMAIARIFKFLWNDSQILDLRRSPKEQPLISESDHRQALISLCVLGEYSPLAFEIVTNHYASMARTNELQAEPADMVAPVLTALARAAGAHQENNDETIVKSFGHLRELISSPNFPEQWKVALCQQLQTPTAAGSLQLAQMCAAHSDVRISEAAIIWARRQKNVEVFVDRIQSAPDFSSQNRFALELKQWADSGHSISSERARTMVASLHSELGETTEKRSAQPILLAILSVVRMSKELSPELIEISQRSLSRLQPLADDFIGPPADLADRKLDMLRLQISELIRHAAEDSRIRALLNKGGLLA